MANLAELRSLIPDIPEVIMQADGFGLWIVWQDEINPVIVQTLEDYGGVVTAQSETQALWFFFTTDVFLAAARLAVWARFNPLAVSMQIFSVRFKFGTHNAKAIVFNEELWQQNLIVSEQLQVLVHTSAVGSISGMPGLSATALTEPMGALTDSFSLMSADPRLPYQSSLSWYAILHPVGNPIDKAFQTGWREFFVHVESVLQRNKYRFTLHNFFLMFPLEGLRQVRGWCQDFLTLVSRLKAEAPEHYWPCVLAVVDRKGINFSEDLPQKINVDWDKLSPDYPHMVMRNSLMLGDDFSVHEVRFAASQHSQEDWSSISLVSEDNTGADVLPQLVPTTVALGNHPHCFYCGLRSHLTSQCPTRNMDERDPVVWRKIARLDFASMRQGVHDIDARLSENQELTQAELAREDSLAGNLLKGFYDLVWPAQVRSISMFWRMRSKDMVKAFTDLAPEDNSPIWPCLHKFNEVEPAELDKELHNLAYRFPKDFRIASLRGFLAVEMGDYTKAIAYWKEAEMFSTFPSIQAWHIFLQARALEYQGLFTQALVEYDECERMCPTWRLLEHRKLVCNVKRGFLEHTLSAIISLVEKDGNFFNKLLMDSEVERGHIQIFASLYSLWVAMENRAEEEERNLSKIRDDLCNWFMPGNSFAEAATERIHKLMQIASYKNYVAFQSICNGRVSLERDIQNYVKQEGREFKAQFTAFIERLKHIHDEAAWFPFPSILTDFNKSYNQSVANLNWAFKANFQIPEAFKKAQMLIDEEAERLKKLEGRMRFLRIIRDSTLFILALFEAFFWLEFAGGVLIFVLLPLILVYGDKIGFDLAATVIAQERWQVQKALFFIVTVAALGIAGLRTVLHFERIREKVFAKAKSAGKNIPKKTGKNVGGK